MIPKAILDFNWKRAFSNNSAHENVCFFGETLKDIFSNYIPNRRIKNDYRKLKWMAAKILVALKKRLKVSKKYYVNPTMINNGKLSSYSKYCSEIIIDAKDKFMNNLSVKLHDLNT